MTVIEQPRGWRVVDVVVAAVLAVAFGAVFQGWNLLWELTVFAFAPFRGLIYGVWMLPAVIVPLVIRRPGAALFGETMAAAVSLLLGSPYGLGAIAYGMVQGAAAELAFAFGLYRSWSLPVAAVAGAAAGFGGAVLDLAFYYPAWATDWQIIYVALVTLSSAFIAGLGGWLLVGALARTGVLTAFPAGREQPRI